METDSLHGGETGYAGFGDGVCDGSEIRVLRLATAGLVTVVLLCVSLPTFFEGVIVTEWEDCNA